MSERKVCIDLICENLFIKQGAGSKRARSREHLNKSTGLRAQSTEHRAWGKEQGALSFSA